MCHHYMLIILLHTTMYASNITRLHTTELTCRTCAATLCKCIMSHYIKFILLLYHNVYQTTLLHTKLLELTSLCTTERN